MYRSYVGAGFPNPNLTKHFDIQMVALTPTLARHAYAFKIVLGLSNFQVGSFASPNLEFVGANCSVAPIQQGLGEE